MRRYSLLIVGFVMVGFGWYLIFTNPQAFPLWFVWLAGPFLWYIGIAVCIGGVGVALFLHSPGQEERGSVTKREWDPDIAILHLQEFAKETSPVRLVREIPAMGGFIM